MGWEAPPGAVAGADSGRLGNVGKLKGNTMEILFDIIGYACFIAFCGVALWAILFLLQAVFLAIVGGATAWSCWKDRNRKGK